MGDTLGAWTQRTQPPGPEQGRGGRLLRNDVHVLRHRRHDHGHQSRHRLRHVGLIRAAETSRRHLRAVGARATSGATIRSAKSCGWLSGASCRREDRELGVGQRLATCRIHVAGAPTHLSRTNTTTGGAAGSACHGQWARAGWRVSDHGGPLGPDASSVCVRGAPPDHRVPDHPAHESLGHGRRVVGTGDRRGSRGVARPPRFPRQRCLVDGDAEHEARGGARRSPTPRSRHSCDR